MSKQRYRILLAEDDANFGMMLKIFLEMNGYAVRLCENGEAAYQAFKKENFDIGIFDVMMPLVDGFTLAEELAGEQKGIPFVFLTAKALKEDQIRGYKIGALDYLVKPFDPEILLLKLDVLLQNGARPTAERLTFQIGNFEFDYAKRTLSLGDEQEKLSPKEAELLKLLCEKEGEVLPHTEAMLKIWKNDDYFTKQSMNVFISKLRKYLSKDTEYHIEIENLHSTGFILKI
jgi:DNA-binding response OmpR family regulator